MTKNKILPTLASVLTPFPYHIDASASINDAREMMTQHDIHHLIVMDKGDIYGVFSDRELQHHGALYGMDKHSDLKISDICSNNITVADIHDPLDKVLEVMAAKHLGSIVALREGELAGIFTTTDACHHFSRFLQETYNNNEIPDMLA